MPRPHEKIIQFTVDGREVRARRGHDARRRRQAGRRRDPVLLLRAEARPPGRRLPHVPRRDRGDPEAPDVVLDAGQGRDGRPHADRPRHATPRTRSSSSCSSTTRSTARCATRAASARCRTSPSAGASAARAFIEPKRHFQKPLALSPLVAIDRERCILCYRCVRFSQEVAEDYQLIFAERGAHTFVATLRRASVRRAVQRQHHRAVPRRRADLAAVPLPRAAVGHRGRRRDLHAVPVAVQRHVHRPRREGPARARPRPPRGRRRLAVRQGPLRLPGDPRRRADHRAARPRRRRAARGLVGAGARRRRRRSPGTRATSARWSAVRRRTRRASCSQRLLREGLGSNDIDSRDGEPVALGLARALAAPALQATVPDLEFAHTVLVLGCEPLDDAPILDLRIRKGVRRRGVQLAIATARPSALDANATRRRPLRPRRRGGVPRARSRARRSSRARRTAETRARELLRDGGEDVVIVWGERIAADALPSLLEHRRARSASRAATAPDCSRFPPAPTAAACARRARCPTPAQATASSEHARPRRRRDRQRRRRRRRSARCICSRPTRSATSRDRALWERALHSAGLVVAHASVLTEGLSEHANVIFPAESYAEKEGTVVHPDGRAAAAARRRSRTRAQVRAGWSVIAETRAGAAALDLGVLTSAMAFKQLVEAVPFYDGITLEQIGGRGVRWPERDAAAAMPRGSGRRRRRTTGDAPRPTRPRTPATARYGSVPTARSGPRRRSRSRRRCTTRSPTSTLELSPEDAQRLGHRARRDASTSRRMERGCRRPPRSAPASRPAPRSSPRASPPTPPTR